MTLSKDEKPTATTAKSSSTAAAKLAKAPKVAVAKPAVAKVAAAKVATTKKSPAKKSKISPEERYRMVEVAAYYIAERHGFAGNTGDFWSEAEKQISKLLEK